MTQSVVVLQARSNSKRLPGKVLLDFNGSPLVILAARRAGNTGRPVVVATSSNETDDALAETLKRFDQPFFRGDLDDVLGRFVAALEGFDDDTVIFRLTSDNVVPDGYLLDEIEEFFISRELDYLTSACDSSGLPYGVSVEAMRLSSLRDAEKATSDDFDREHVTPWIRRKFGSTIFTKRAGLGMSLYRCTIDCFDDYVSMRKLFDGIVTPVESSYLDVLKFLQNSASEPRITRPASKLIIGTVQLGMNYGISNVTGRPDMRASCHLIRTGILNGVTCIDTARAYGESEFVVGNALGGGWCSRAEVVTKLSPMNECPRNAEPKIIKAFAEASLFKSLTALSGQNISTMLLHRADQINAWNGVLRASLLGWKSEGVIKKIGVSVQSPAELAMAFRDPEIEHIQLPFNLLDGRWDGSIEEIVRARKGRDLTVHVRSVFLQGLLVSRNPTHWRKANVKDPQRVWNWLDQLTHDFDKPSVSNLCIAYATAFEWVDGVVIGMETLDQLNENLQNFASLPLTWEEINLIRETRPALTDATVDPALWVAD
jgi:spore coat polysaccharide biosynthesis protein SpsF (cytidylyltransferase family)/aryl-alcohol dehydrogenase-like predicted oxidoreductase